VFRIEDETGRLVQEGRIDTSRADLTRVFARRAPLRVLLESSTDSEGVAGLLEGLGHEVIVADPSYLPMDGSRQRKVKTDRRDTLAWVTAGRQGHDRCAHRVPAATRTARQELRVRRHLVQMRTQTINVLRALLRQEGLRLPGGEAERAVPRLARLAVPPALARVLQPLQTWLATVQTLIAAADAAVATAAASDPVARHLMTVPGVGPVTALTYQAVLDTPARFNGDPGRASAFLGLVPAEYSSGDHRRQGQSPSAGHASAGAGSCRWAGRSGEAGAPLVRPCANGPRRGPLAAAVASPWSPSRGA
jgi:transposase